MSDTHQNESQAARDATSRIGDRLTQLRVARKIRISELARRVSVSPSLISQIERGQSRPSVTTLFALAQALEVPVDALFGEEAEATAAAEAAESVGVAAGERQMPVGDVVWRVPNGSLSAMAAGAVNYMLHKDHRATIDIRGGVRWERLTPTSLKGLEFLELVYQPGAESDPSLYRHPGIELVLVLENRLDIHVGFDLYQLGVGDSIAFPSSTPHRYVNPTDLVTRAVTVIVRDDLSSMPATTGAEFEE